MARRRKNQRYKSETDLGLHPEDMRRASEGDLTTAMIKAHPRSALGKASLKEDRRRHGGARGRAMFRMEREHRDKK